MCVCVCVIRVCVCVSHAKQGILASTAALLRAFPWLYGECAVAVARKTDISLWPSLFQALGTPSAVLDGLMERGALVAAANMLLVVDSMQGATVAYAKAVRLLQVCVCVCVCLQKLGL